MTAISDELDDAPAFFVPMRLRRELRDARTWQILALAGLLGWNIASLSLGAALAPSLVAIFACLGTQAFVAWHLRLPAVDLRSPLVTGLSLSLLLRGDALWVPVAAGVVAIASKFLLRVGGKHVFNPAAFAIVLLLATGRAWVTPGQWGASVLVASAITFLAILVLTRATRLDIALVFLATHAALLVTRAIWLGDPMSIPLHQLANGGLLLFAFFMITDPRSTPDARGGRLLFAIAVAGLAHWLAFAEQMRPALYVALVALSVLTPLLDRLFPGERFLWRPRAEIGQ